jgi:hypothetical protein
MTTKPQLVLLPESSFYEKGRFLWIFKNFTPKFRGHYEHIQSPPTPSRKILFDPLKILQNGGKGRENTKI